MGWDKEDRGIDEGDKEDEEDKEEEFFFWIWVFLKVWGSCCLL